MVPERPCGFCHQAAYFLARILDQHGISAYPLGLNGHVVTLVNIDNHRMIFDPDFGVGPFPYNSELWEMIADAYPSAISQNEVYSVAYEQAFRTVDDDVPYYNLQWLVEAEQQQRTALQFANLIAIFLGGGGIIYLSTGLVGRWKQK